MENGAFAQILKYMIHVHVFQRRQCSKALNVVTIKILLDLFSVTADITIGPSKDTYCGLYSKGIMSAVTGLCIFRLLLNSVFFCPETFFYLNKQCIP